MSFAGYDVIENQSGKREGKTRISKKGNSHIRRILHLPAFNAVRFGEPACKALFERVYTRSHYKMNRIADARLCGSPEKAIDVVFCTMAQWSEVPT